MIRSSNWAGIVVLLLLVITACNSARGGQPQDAVRQAPSLLGKTWLVRAIAGSQVEGGLELNLRFSDDGTVAGRDGCNSFGGPVSVKGSLMRFSPNLASTMMACPDQVGSLAQKFMSALRKTASYTIDGGRLVLKDDAGSPQVELGLAPSSLEGTSWQVASYNNGKQAVVSLLAGTTITLTFGNDGRVTGTAGCNRYFAPYSIEDETVTIGSVGASRKFCGEPEGVMDQERFFLESLAKAGRIEPSGERMYLRTSEGSTVAVLVPSEVR